MKPLLLALTLGFSTFAWAQTAPKEVALATTVEQSVPAPAPRPAPKEMPIFSADARQPKPRARPDFSHVGLPCEPRPRMCTEVIQ
jgi:hypothetical protein